MGRHYTFKNRSANGYDIKLPVQDRTGVREKGPLQRKLD